MNDIKRNSSGERLYKDSSGANCNIRGMIRREPGWVASRFEFMQDKIERQAAEIQRLKGENERLEVTNERLRGISLLLLSIDQAIENAANGGE